MAPMKWPGTWGGITINTVQGTRQERLHSDNCYDHGMRAFHLGGERFVAESGRQSGCPGTRTRTCGGTRGTINAYPGFDVM